MGLGLGKHWNVEERRNIGLRMKEVWRTKRKGWKHSKETKEILSEKAKTQFNQHPELRDLSRKIAKEVLQSQIYSGVCKTCGKRVVFQRKRGAFCSSKCLQIWYRKIWYGREYTDHRGRITHNYDSTVINSEKFIAQDILPKLDFTNILLARDSYSLFAFDILAKKNGEIYGIHVTTGWTVIQKKIRRSIPLSEFFGLKILIFYVKPDLTYYTFNEYDPHQRKRGTFSAIGRYLKHIGIKKR